MSLDPTQLALAAFNFLLPHLDYLRGKVADSALSESGKALVAVVKDQWLAKNEAASAAVDEVAKDPADTDNRDLLLTFLRKALKADPDLAADIARLLPAAAAESRQTLDVSGDNNKVAQVSGQGHTVTIG